MTARLRGPVEPVALSADDIAAAHDSSLALAEFVQGDDQRVTLRLEDRETGRQLEAAVPAAALRLLAGALAQMAEGRPVTLVPMGRDLSTQQAADLMGVSRPYFVKLLEEGQIPFHKVGSQRRVKVDALQRYMALYQKDAVRGLEEMTAEAQRMGLYE